MKTAKSLLQALAFLAIGSLVIGSLAYCFAQLLIGTYIRKTPNFDVPLIGPLAMADRHIPSTVRVSRGSITPSS